MILRQTTTMVLSRFRASQTSTVDGPPRHLCGGSHRTVRRGCSTFVHYLNELEPKYEVVPVSAFLRDRWVAEAPPAELRVRESAPRNVLQRMGDELRRGEGNEALIRHALAHAVGRWQTRSRRQRIWSSMRFVTSANCAGCGSNWARGSRCSQRCRCGDAVREGQGGLRQCRGLLR